MAVKLGSTVQELIDAVNDASQVPSNMMTTDTSQTINAAKTFAKEVAFDNQIRANGGVGTAGQVLTSQGANKAPIWKTPSGGSAPSNMVTTDTAQNITGTKTFMYTRVTGNTIYKDCELVFENADGGQQSLRIDDSMSSSCVTSFVMPKILQEATFELGTALYNHCVILSGTNCHATFNVLCNNPDAFTSLTDMWNSVMAYQKNPHSGYRIAASGRVYGSPSSAVKIVDYVQFNSTAGSVGIHCLGLTSATTTTLTASFVSDSVISCNLTMN